MHDGLLKSYKGSVSFTDSVEEGGGVIDAVDAASFTRKPHDAGVGEVGARRMTDHEIKAEVLDKTAIALKVRDLWAFGRFNAARGDIGASCYEHFGDNATGLPDDEDTHASMERSGTKRDSLKLGFELFPMFRTGFGRGRRRVTSAAISL